MNIVQKMMKMRIQQRLKTNSILSVGITGIGTLLAIIAMLYMIAQYNRVLTYYAFPQGDIGNAMAILADIRSATRGAIGYEKQDHIDKMVAAHDKKIEELNGYLENIKGTIVTDVGRKNFEHIIEHVMEYIEIDQKVLELGTSNDKEDYTLAHELAFSEMSPIYNEAYDALQELMDSNIELGDTTHISLRIMTIVLTIIIIMIVAFVIIMSIRINTVIANGIANPMKDLIERLKTFEQGDISSPFPVYDVDDEVGDMVTAVSETTGKLQKIISDLVVILNHTADGDFDIRTTCEEEYVGEFSYLLSAIRKMNNQMSDALKEVRAAAEMVSSGAGNLAEASGALAEGSTDQAASVQEMLATMDDITSGIKKNLDEVNKAYDKAKKCAIEADSSRAEMDTMISAMTRISETSNKIENIIEDIEDIASQTNLLSLNAAIEAARAGDSGRGFAVVADQIRSLAEQSAKSAVNTRELIECSIMEVKNGNQAAAKTAGVLENVVKSIQSIADTSKDLSELSAQQAEAMNQADAGISRISEVVQSNSATAQEASATSEELSAQANSLEELVHKFNLRKN
ncbi:MAG: methyl-accepting chemotaxis protein [Lachnospiraceae bacterium]|nr:methyl-accepting chemotaxis protein [Lachnospiraceae bacterium]MBQ5851921.1 methyl-accepting chemotaxis protein [Lachnospiraceae bacterium]